MTRRTELFPLAGLLGAALLLVAAGCTNRIDGVPDTDDGGVPDQAMVGPYQDFPSTPIIDKQPGSGMSAPANSGDLFGDANYGAPTGGPCLLEPQIGSLFPRNWLRLRFRFTPPAGHNLFEIRLHVANQQNDLVVYTTATTWVMPADLWKRLAYHSAGQAMTVAVRSGALQGSALSGPPALGSKGELNIAPADAAGTIVYWTTTAGTKLRGFAIGDESVADVITPAQSDAGVQCIGCHSSTPDGNYVAYSQTRDPGNGDPAFIGLRSVDKKATEPPWLSAAAKTLLGRQKQQAPTFSASHWVPGDRVLITAWQPTGAATYDLMWTDLEATSTDQDKGWGILTRQDDARSIASPVFGHSGNFVVYTAASSVDSGIAARDGDIYLVPYSSRKGGKATPIAGASDPQWNESHAALSPDDLYVAFNRVPNGEYSSNNVKQEVYMVPRAGGMPTRLAANDAPACSGLSSPGINNSWPKWSPDVQTVMGKKYYWLSFSSSRGSAEPQLYVAPVVVDDSGVTTYPALYLWNQPTSEGNHTAAWDVFKLVVE
jgi:mono/diheme cytochrome c family protein